MVADRQQKAQVQGILSRGGPALAVIGIHLILIYVISASMGIVPIPTITPPSKVVFIDDQPEIKPEPVVEPEIKPPTQVTQQVAPDVPQMPLIEEDLPPAPPATTALDARTVAEPEPAVSPAQQLKAKQRVEPIYPSASRRDGEEGAVRLRVLVDESGRPSEVQIAQSSGFSRLDQAAAEAVRRWRSQAATNGGGAISVCTQVVINLRLTDAARR